ncbi:MAG TPA: protocatechuate 3,4-dioxygenase [Brevundimonas sp.]|nr:protocatechuate 3,4-dioxygenase [Brevundimonas sp.]
MRQLHRRGLIGGLGVGLVGFAAPAILTAQQPPRPTPPTAFQMEGPFYPYDDMPSDRDADLVRVTGVEAQAMGQVTHMTGSVWDQFGQPLAGALIEIWQCDHTGRYLHRDDPNTDRPRDAGFQGYGKAVADARGGFRFRTIKPVAYTALIGGEQIWRAPHIHAAISTRGVRRLTTQLYVAGAPQNEADMLLQLVSPAEREGLIRPFTPGTGAESGALAAHYDLIVAV